MFQQAVEIVDLCNEVKKEIVDCSKIKKEVIVEILNFLEKEELTDCEKKGILLLTLELIQEPQELFLEAFEGFIGGRCDFEHHSTV
jgi:5'(3')-deoxyribonucleotidase